MRRPGRPRRPCRATRPTACGPVRGCWLSAVITRRPSASWRRRPTSPASRGQRVFELLALGDALRLGGNEHAARSCRGGRRRGRGLGCSGGRPRPGRQYRHRRGPRHSGSALRRRGSRPGRRRTGGGGLGRVPGGGVAGAGRGFGPSGPGAARRVRRCLHPGVARPARGQVEPPRARGRGAGRRGQTNAAIAESLGISVRTVESHLYSVFGKLGIGDRTALPAALAGLMAA